MHDATHNAPAAPPTPARSANKQAPQREKKQAPKRELTLAEAIAALSEDAADAIVWLDHCFVATPHLLKVARDPLAWLWTWLLDPRRPHFARLSQRAAALGQLEFGDGVLAPALAVRMVSEVDGRCQLELHDGRVLRLPAPELVDQLEADRAARGEQLRTYVRKQVARWGLAREEQAALELLAERQHQAALRVHAALRELRAGGFIEEPSHRRIARRTKARALYAEQVRGPSAALARRALRDNPGEGGRAIRTINLARSAVALARHLGGELERKHSYDNYAVSVSRVDHQLGATLLYVRLLGLQAVGLLELVEFEPEFQWDDAARSVRADVLVRVARPEALGDEAAQVAIAVEVDMGTTLGRDPRPGDDLTTLLRTKFRAYEELGRALKLPRGRELRLAFLTPEYAGGGGPLRRGELQLELHKHWQAQLGERELVPFIPLAEPTPVELASRIEQHAAKAYATYLEAQQAKSA